VKSTAVRPDQLWVSPELERSHADKQFDERLRASIEQIGLVEPLKVASSGDRRYLIVDGVLRWRAIQAIRTTDETRFTTIPAYVVKHDQRHAIRFQTDIYQDLLPSQLAALVEHLHQNDHIQKSQIAAYIGVSAPTVRNYTGLWRLMKRGGLFARIVELMDAGVVPSSSPYAWLRLTHKGLRTALAHLAAAGELPAVWIDRQLHEAAAGRLRRLPLQDVETITGGLPPDCYREGEELRSKKRELGLRRSKPQLGLDSASSDVKAPALRNLRLVVKQTTDPVLRIAAESLKAVVA
jgi:hypothetical protein